MASVSGRSGMSGFSVVSMMREPAEVVGRFVDYYRRLGATDIFIYYNGPASEVPDSAAEVCTLCTPAFWAPHGGEPRELEQRQRICYADGYSRCRTEWLLVVDADEYVFGDRPLAQALASIPPDVESVAFPTAEAVWGPGDDIDEPFGCTHFRTAWRRRSTWLALAPLIYGPSCGHLKRGVAGHDAGKQVVRTGRADLRIDLHATARDGVSVTRRAPTISPELAGFYVAHFDAISLARWEHKWRLRSQSGLVLAHMAAARQRRQQQRMIVAGLANGRSREVFARIYGLNALQFRLLALLGKGFRRRDVLAAPGRSPDGAAPADPFAATVAAGPPR
jgi:hypothetical protein